MNLDRRSALKLVTAGGAVVLGGPVVAAAQESQRAASNRPSEAPKVSSAIDSTGRALERVSGGNVLEIAFYSFQFTESDGNSWKTQKQTVTPPSGWRQVSVSVAGSDLHFGHDFYEDHNFGHSGAYAGVSLSGSTLEVSAHAILRDINGDDKWKGSVRVQAIYIG